MANNITFVNNNTFTVGDNNTEAYGAYAGGTTEVVKILAGVTDVKLDANFERVELSGSFADYTFDTSLTGSFLIKNAAGSSIIATIPNINQSVTLKFLGDSTQKTLTQTGTGVFDVGNTVVSTTTYAITTPTTSITEGNPVTFTVTPSSTSSVTRTLNYQISGVVVGSAAAASNSDFSVLTGTVTIPANAVSAPFTVTPINDGVVEGFKGFKVDLLDSAFNAIATSSSVVIGDGAPIQQTNFVLTSGADNLDESAATVALTFDASLSGSNTTLNNNDSIQGGSANDLINVELNGVSRTPAQLTGVETINVTSTTGTSVLDLTHVTGVNRINSVASLGNLTLNNLQSLSTVIAISDTTAVTTIDVANSAVSGSTDTLNVTLNNVLAASDNTADLVIDSAVETLALTVVNGNTIDTDYAGKITITGDATATIGLTGVTGYVVAANVDATNLQTPLTLDTTDAVHSVTGGSANDVITSHGASAANGVNFSGLAGDDQLIGAAGNDTLSGGVGNDTLTAGAGTDSINGGADDDRIIFATAADLDGTDTVDGGTGSNTLVVTASDAASASAYTHVSNIQILEISDAVTGNVNVSDIASSIMTVTTKSTSTSGVFTFNAGASTLNLGGAIATAATFNDSTTATTDSLTITKNYVANANAFGGVGITIGGIETLTFNTGSTAIATTQTTGAIGLTSDGTNTNTTVNATGVNKFSLGAVTTNGTGKLTISGSGLTAQASGTTFTVAAPVVSVSGTVSITGSGGADSLTGDINTVNTIIGGAGSDTITGGSLLDSLDGGTGNDIFLFSAVANLSADTIIGGSDSADEIQLSNGAVAFSVAAADLANISGIEKITTDTLTTTLSVTLTNAVYTSNGATNFFVDGNNIDGNGGAGTDLTVDASALTGTNAVTVVLSTADSLTDSVFGGAGDDVFKISGNAIAADADNIDGGSGTDTIYIDNSASGTLTADFTAATVSGIENITVYGDAGDVAITTDDVLLTAAGTVTVNASALATTYTLNFDGSGELDGATSLFNVTGGNAADTIKGGAGNDILNGGAGSDTITAGAGEDSLTGGTGNDQFVLAGNLTTADTIVGGADSADEITADGGLVATNFAHVSGVEKLSASTTGVTWSLAADASTAGINNITLSTGTNSLTLASGFANAATVNLTTGTDTVTNTANVALTVAAAPASIASTDVLTGGSGIDTLVLTSDNHGTGANLGGTTLFETVTVLQGTAGNDAKITTGAYATALTINGSALDANSILTVVGTNATAPLNITGGLAADALTGGDSTDTFAVASSDSITAGAGNDTINFTGVIAAATAIGGSGDDVITFAGAVTSAANIDGDTGNDTITFTGAVTAATIVGGTGNDTVTFNSPLANAARITSVETVNGGAGSDTLTFTATETATINGNGGSDVINLNATGTNTITFNALTSSNQVSITGGAGVDKVTVVGTAASTIAGGGGADSLYGGSGADTFKLTAANVALVATIDGGLGSSDIITISNTGNINASKVTGVETLNYEVTSTSTLILGGSGIANITTTTGDQAITLASAQTTALNVNLGTGTDTFLLASGTNSGLITVTGAAGSVTVTGNSGDDKITVMNAAIIVSGGGNDSLTGSTGSDTYQFASAVPVGSTVNGGGGSDTISITADTNNGAINLSGVTNIGSGTLEFLGDTTSTDLITLGASGITSITGADAQTNALGFGGAVTGVTINLGDTNDDDSDSIALGDYVNSITVNSRGVSVTGGSLADTITYAAAIASATVNGGAGNDTVILQSGVNTLGSVTGVETITGGTGNDSITFAGATTTTITGGGGNDSVATAANVVSTITFNTSSVSNLVTITGGSGNDLITVSGSGAAKFVGSAGSDVLTGGVADDIFEFADSSNIGGTKSTIVGGIGNDTISIVTDTSGNVDVGTTVSGVEILNFAGAFTTGGSERVTLGTSGITTITGSVGNNQVLILATPVTGTLAVDLGATGADSLTLANGGNVGISVTNIETVTGGTGNDAITTLTAASVVGGDGNDTITGSTGADTIVGGSGADSITAGSGADVITGGAGADVLTGGADADVFVYTAFGDSTGSAVDTISDFTTAQNDVLQFAVTLSATQTFVAADRGVVSTLGSIFGNLTTVAGDYAFITDTNQLAIDVDGNGTINASDYRVTLTGNTTAPTGAGIAFNITGGSGDNAITTGSGADTITGGGGTDIIDGGLGNDTYVFSTATGDTGLAGGTTGVLSTTALDVITVTAGDKIDLTASLGTDAGYDTVTRYTAGNASALTVVAGSGTGTVVITTGVYDSSANTFTPGNSSPNAELLTWASADGTAADQSIVLVGTPAGTDTILNGILTIV